MRHVSHVLSIHLIPVYSSYLSYQRRYFFRD
nr:MAG TPA: hypothetical protein [Caudoviricetes sp.]